MGSRKRFVFRESFFRRSLDKADPRSAFGDHRIPNGREQNARVGPVQGAQGLRQEMPGGNEKRRTQKEGQRRKGERDGAEGTCRGALLLYVMQSICGGQLYKHGRIQL